VKQLSVVSGQWPAAGSVSSFMTLMIYDVEVCLLIAREESAGNSESATAADRIAR
jgi:hypothetical protein